MIATYIVLVLHNNFITGQSIVIDGGHTIHPA